MNDILIIFYLPAEVPAATFIALISRFDWFAFAPIHYFYEFDGLITVAPCLLSPCLQFFVIVHGLVILIILFDLLVC
jgi:hypothetical protein